MGQNKGELTENFFGPGRRPDLDKYLYRPTYVLRKLGESDSVVLRRFVTYLNLSLELAITTPLKVELNQQKIYFYTTTPKVLLTPIRICVVVCGLSRAGICAFKRVSHWPITAASRGRPSIPSVCWKNMGICNSASWT